MTDNPLCPDCGRLMIHFTSPGTYVCVKCSEPPDEIPLPLWMKIFILVFVAIMMSLLLLMMVFRPPGSGGLVNVTQAMGEVGEGGDLYLIICGIVIIIFVNWVFYAMERGKERCPSCGEVLRLVHEVQKYKCLHCGSWYPREDIEVEVVE